jgi:DNA-binding CsgD family transcriptional regulator
MPRQKSSVEVFKALAQELGIKALADLHAESVKDRPPPPRLLARILRTDNSVLTKREREIMVLLASGYRRAEIGDELGISVETVKHYLRSAYGKMNVHNQIQAINHFLEEEA